MACSRVRCPDYNSPSWELRHAAISPFEGGHLRTNYREGVEPHLLAENWIKDLLNMALPAEQDPVFPTTSPFHQEACTILLSSSIIGQTVWKPNHRKLAKLITWITALSNSVKLWAMPCSATQDGWVMEENSDKTWSTGERNDKSAHYSCFENPMSSMKRQKKMWHWNMNSPGQ